MVQLAQLWSTLPLAATAQGLLPSTASLGPPHLSLLVTSLVVRGMGNLPFIEFFIGPCFISDFITGVSKRWWWWWWCIGIKFLQLLPTRWCPIRAKEEPMIVCSIRFVGPLRILGIGVFIRGSSWLAFFVVVSTSSYSLFYVNAWFLQHSFGREGWQTCIFWRVSSADVLSVGLNLVASGFLNDL